MIDAITVEPLFDWPGVIQSLRVTDEDDEQGKSDLKTPPNVLAQLTEERGERRVVVQNVVEDSREETKKVGNRRVERHVQRASVPAHRVQRGRGRIAEQIGQSQPVGNAEDLGRRVVSVLTRADRGDLERAAEPFDFGAFDREQRFDAIMPAEPLDDLGNDRMDITAVQTNLVAPQRPNHVVPALLGQNLGAPRVDHEDPRESLVLQDIR